MKKIIDGALYNTETATRLGIWSNNLSDRDFNNCTEELYRTKSGKYFLYGEGGPNSKYGEWHGNSGGSGEEIRSYSPAEAAEWAEEKLNADEYAELFGEPEEAAVGREALNISVPAEIKRRLEKMREESGRSISRIIEDLLK